jgi:hypothetical protein
MSDLLNQKLEITPACGIFIRKAGRQYNVIAILFTSATILGWLMAIWRFKRGLMGENNGWMYTFDYYIYPVLVILQGLCTLFQLYYYFNGVRLQNRAIAESNQLLFEKSFRHYFLGNRVSIISILINLSIEVVVVYQVSVLDPF